MSDWSSFKNDKKLSDNWRSFLNEGTQRLDEAPYSGTRLAQNVGRASAYAHGQPRQMTSIGAADHGKQEEPQAEYPADGFAELHMTLQQVNQRLKNVVANDAITQDLEKLFADQNFVIKEGPDPEGGSLYLDRYPELNLDNYKTLGALVGAATASPQLVKALNRAFKRAGFKGVNIQAKGGASAPRATPAPADGDVKALFQQLQNANGIEEFGEAYEALRKAVLVPHEKAGGGSYATFEAIMAPLIKQRHKNPQAILDVLGTGNADSDPSQQISRFLGGANWSRQKFVELVKDWLGSPSTDDAAPPTDAGGEAGGPADTPEEEDSGPPRQVDKMELRMAASKLADPYGGGLVKKAAPSLSDEEIKGLRQLLAQWLGTMNMKLMQEITKRILQEATPYKGVADQEVKPTRKGVGGREKRQGIPDAPSLQPLDLAPVYDIVKDPETARFVAALIAQTVERVGARVENKKPPEVADDRKEKGEEEEEGILDKLGGMAATGLDSAAAAADAVRETLDGETVKKLESALDAAALASAVFPGVGEVVGTPVALLSLAIDIGQGDWQSALINTIALVPVVGDAAKAGATAAKAGSKSAKAYDLVAKGAKFAGPMVQRANAMKKLKGTAAIVELAANLTEQGEKLGIGTPEDWLKVFESAESKLEALASLPGVGEDIQKILDKHGDDIAQVKKHLTTAEGVSKGKIPGLTDTPTANLQEAQVKRWQQLAGINPRVL